MEDTEREKEEEEMSIFDPNTFFSAEGKKALAQGQKLPERDMWNLRHYIRWIREERYENGDIKGIGPGEKDIKKAKRLRKKKELENNKIEKK